MAYTILLRSSARLMYSSTLLHNEAFFLTSTSAEGQTNNFQLCTIKLHIHGRSVASLSPWMPRFNLRSVHKVFVVDRVASTSLLSYQYHATDAPHSYFIHIALMIYNLNISQHWWIRLHSHITKLNLMTVTNQQYVNERILKSLNMENACHHSLQYASFISKPLR